MGRHNTSILLDSLFACSSNVVNVMVFCCRLYSTKSVSKLNFIPMTQSLNLFIRRRILLDAISKYIKAFSQVLQPLIKQKLKLSLTELRWYQVYLRRFSLPI